MYHEHFQFFVKSFSGDKKIINKKTGEENENFKTRTTKNAACQIVKVNNKLVLVPDRSFTIYVAGEQQNKCLRINYIYLKYLKIFSLSFTCNAIHCGLLDYNIDSFKHQIVLLRIG